MKLLFHKNAAGQISLHFHNRRKVAKSTPLTSSLTYWYFQHCLYQPWGVKLCFRIRIMLLLSQQCCWSLLPPCHTCSTIVLKLHATHSFQRPFSCLPSVSLVIDKKTAMLIQESLELQNMSVINHRISSCTKYLKLHYALLFSNL